MAGMGLFGFDSDNMMASDPRTKKAPKGGSIHASQDRDTSYMITGDMEDGGPGFMNPDAFTTPAQRRERDRPSYEEQYNLYGGKSGAAGLDRMTDAEREEYKTSELKIAKTKTDDYSDWGKKRKADADEAHSKGLLSKQDKKDQRIIDTRKTDQYNWDVVAPAQEEARRKRAKDAETKNMIQGPMGRMQADLAATGSAARSYKSKLSGAFQARKGTGQRAVQTGASRGTGKQGMDTRTTPSNPWKSESWSRDPRKFTTPKEDRQAPLLKDGWTPEEAEEWGGTGGIHPFDAIAVQSALPGVQSITQVEAAAQYGGTGAADPYSMQMIAGTAMDPKQRQAMYGQGLDPYSKGGIITLAPEHGGQVGGGPSQMNPRKLVELDKATNSY